MQNYKVNFFEKGKGSSIKGSMIVSADSIESATDLAQEKVDPRFTWADAWETDLPERGFNENK